MKTEGYEIVLTAKTPKVSYCTTMLWIARVAAIFFRHSTEGDW